MDHLTNIPFVKCYLKNVHLNEHKNKRMNE